MQQFEGLSSDQQGRVQDLLAADPNETLTGAVTKVQAGFGDPNLVSGDGDYLGFKGNVQAYTDALSQADGGNGLSLVDASLPIPRAGDYRFGLQVLSDDNGPYVIQDDGRKAHFNSDGVPETDVAVVPSRLPDPSDPNIDAYTQATESERKQSYADAAEKMRDFANRSGPPTSPANEQHTSLSEDFTGFLHDSGAAVWNAGIDFINFTGDITPHMHDSPPLIGDEHRIPYYAPLAGYTYEYLTPLVATKLPKLVAITSQVPNRAERLVTFVDEGGNLRAGGNPGMSPKAYDYQSGASGARSNPLTGRSQAPYLSFVDESGAKIGAKFDSVNGNELIDRKLNPFFSPKAVDEALRQAAVASHYGLQAVWELPDQAAYNAALRFMKANNVTGITVRIAP